MYKRDGLFMKDWFFVPMFMLLASAMFGGMHLSIKYGYGGFLSLQSRIYISEGQWVLVASMGFGLFLARILEGSMVGLLDIGGGCMYGVVACAGGMVGVLGMEWIFDNFVLSLIAGAIVGFVEAAIILIVRKMMPPGTASAGSDIMLAVNTSSAQYMAPLYIIMGLKYSIPLGVCGVIGGLIMHLRGQNMIGGIVLGMFVAAFIFA